MEELEGPLQEVFKELRRQWKAFQDSEPFLDVLKGFINAIDWREPWIIGILSIDVILIILAFTTRKRNALQFVLFLLSGGIAMASELLNSLGSQHWEKFATQNYFDSSGVFVCAVVSGPLLLVMFIVLVNYLINCSTLLIEAKKQELKYKARQRAKNAKRDNDRRIS